MDLFAFRNEYPDHPGFKARATAAAAAIDMAPRAPRLREMALAAIKASTSGLTADEVAARLGKTVLSIRPRVAELACSNLVLDSGVTRENVSGKQATVWTVA